MSYILGVDYGERRMGLAVSDPEAIVAIPLSVVRVYSDNQRISVIRSAVGEKNVVRVIVGLPLNMNGSIGPAAEKVRRFVGRLSAALAVPVETWDERLSSSLAERAMLDARINSRKRRKVVDKMAAQVILQTYLDARSGVEYEFPEEEITQS